MKNAFIYETILDDMRCYDDVRFLKSALDKYNGDFLETQKHFFVITVKDVLTIIAGVFARTEDDILYLDTLYVDEKYRKQKLGTQLLQLAENKGLELHCKKCIVDTLGFQAQAFYEKYGYHVFAQVP